MQQLGGYFAWRYMVKENAYISIQAFMVNDLKLGGNELITFAIIYGFSQDGESWFTGSRKYIADWCQTTTKSVTANLQKLVAKGYVQKRTRTEHGLTLNDYRVNPSIVPPGKKLPSTGEETSLPPREETSPHNIEVDKASRKPNLRAFEPPTLSEVTAYCEKKGYHFDPSRFFDYYEASGWRKANGKKVSNWKQCCVTWEARTDRGSEVKWDADLEELAAALDF